MIKLDGTLSEWDKRTRPCRECGVESLVGNWPIQRDGKRARHCGCVKPRIVGNTWTPERQIEMHRARRERKAKAAGKQYRTRAQIKAGVKLAASYPDAKHMAALRTIGRMRRKAAHLRSVHDAHVEAYRAVDSATWWRWRYANSPEFNVRERLRRSLRKQSEAVPGLAELIRTAVKRAAKSSRIEALLGYSVADLKAHIERQFTKGMGWNKWDRNGIHIDHILPRKCFDLTTIEGARAYWSLSNLRPLWKKQNLIKSDKIEFLL